MSFRHCLSFLILLLLFQVDDQTVASNISIQNNPIPDSLKIEKQYYYLYSWLRVADKRKDDFFGLDIQHEPSNLPPDVPNPFSPPNSYLITVPAQGVVLLVLKGNDNKIKTVYDLGVLKEGAAIYYSTDELFRDRKDRYGGPNTLYVFVDKKIYLKIDLYPIGKNSLESLQEYSGIYYPDCLVFDIGDNKYNTYPDIDWAFSIDEDSTLASLELLDNQKRPKRVFFKAYFNAGDYGLIFRKIDGKGKHLELGEYYFLLKKEEKENLEKFDLVE